MTDAPVKDLYRARVGDIGLWMRWGNPWDHGIAEEVQQAYYWDTVVALKPDVILDIGGHIGSYACYARHRMPNASIISVEAEWENFGFLQKNTYPLIDVKAIHAYVEGGAQSPEDRALRCVIYDKGINTGAHYIGWLNDDEALSGQVRVEEAPRRMRLSDLVKELPDDISILLKLDCEGSEVSILHDLIRSKRLRSLVKCIVGERHIPEADFKAAVGDYLAGFYDVTYTDSTDPTLGTFLAVRKDE